MVDLHTDALSFSSDSYSFPPSTNLENFWKRKLSKWIKNPQNLQVHTPTNSLLPPFFKKTPPKQNIQPRNLVGFFCQLTLEMFCERPNLQISGMRVNSTCLFPLVFWRLCAAHMWGQQNAELQQSSLGNTSYSHGTMDWMDAIHTIQLWMQNTN